MSHHRHQLDGKRDFEWRSKNLSLDDSMDVLFIDDDDDVHLLEFV
jgi:hypothetical protein